MGLIDFFRINMPYGIVKTKQNGWVAFNREYQPLGFNNTYSQPRIDINDEQTFEHLPINTKYPNVTEKLLTSLIDENTSVEKDDKGNITRIFLYDDGTNPVNVRVSKDIAWDKYFEKIKILSGLKTTK